MTDTTRRQFLRMAGVAVLAPLGRPASLKHHIKQRSMHTLYIGTYTRDDSEGIYRCVFDDETGALEVRGVTGLIENPSFLAAHPSGRYLYAVSETTEFDGQPGGGVYAYAVNRDGRLAPLNRQPAHGGAPCYVSVTPDGNHVLAANYLGGNVAIFPVGEDGRLGEASDVAQHEGSGPNERRQESPHAHCVVVGPSGDRAFVADLGIDRVVGYRIDAGKLVPAGTASVAPGAGPRHVTFHPDGRRAYVINELDSTITTFSYVDGMLQNRQTIGTLPDSFDGSNTTADIHVSADGRFLYGSNRGHDSIVVYSIQPENGTLSLVQHVSTGGRTPRNFALGPTGRFLLAANQNSDTVVVFSIDAGSGRLTDTGQVLHVPSPVCVRFLPTA